jgi:hypothetical protein
MAFRPVFGPWPPRSPTFSFHCCHLTAPCLAPIYDISPNNVFQSTSSLYYGHSFPEISSLLLCEEDDYSSLVWSLATSASSRIKLLKILRLYAICIFILCI